MTREERRNAVQRAAHPSRVASPAKPGQSRRSRSGSGNLEGRVPQKPRDPRETSAGAFAQSPAVRLGLPLPSDPVRAARALRTPAEVSLFFLYSGSWSHASQLYTFRHCMERFWHTKIGLNYTQILDLRLCAQSRKKWTLPSGIETAFCLSSA